MHEFVSINNRRGRNINDENERITVKLLFGGDFLASFNVPGLWSTNDVIFRDILPSEYLLEVIFHRSFPTICRWSIF